MGLKMTGGRYKGRTRSLYSSNGETWYEDSNHTIPADMTKYHNTDDADLGFFALVIGLILMCNLFCKLFL